jgi:hypothetical protein
MARGGTVVYFDEELGRDAIAQRLIDLGADPDVVEKQFVYCPFPSWQIGSSAEPTEPDMHRDALRALKGDLQLVVYDTVTDALAEAGMDENSGVDVTRWVKAYPEEARKLGAAALVLDHTGKSNGDTAVGSRAKRAKAKVQFKLKSSGRFDRDTTNEVVVTLKKNTSGAVGIPDRRVFKVGGDGEGHFLWEPMFASTGELKTAVTANRIRTDLVARIGNLPGVTQRNLFANVPGETKAKGSELAWLISDGTVRVEPGARNSICHFLSSTATDVG